MFNFKDTVNERTRITTFEINEDETVNHRVFWRNPDGTEETISEQVIQNKDIYQSLQDFFAGKD